ncbi:MAG: hypothetical protein ACRDRJ_26240 [Streptosporangiaceae bacterium]
MADGWGGRASLAGTGNRPASMPARILMLARILTLARSLDPL